MELHSTTLPKIRAILHLFSNLRPLYLCIVLQILVRNVEAGTCWLRMGVNGRCQHLWEEGVSKEKCCHGTGVNWAWTPHDNVTSSQHFYWQVIQHGAPQCSRCHNDCDNVACTDGKKCRMRRGEPKCVCAPTCSRQGRRRGTVCGSDGRTYRHKCSLLKYNCRHTENVFVDYYGKCKRSCTDVQCESGKQCASDQNGLPHCLVCAQNCRRPGARNSPMCGSNGVTYPSLCHYRQAACFAGGLMSIAYRGECRADITCEEMQCSMSQKCLRDLTTGRLQCLTCDFDCNMMENKGPVCGTDNVTYQDWCQLRRTACQTGIVINTKHNGACHETVGGSVDDYYYSSGSTSFE